MLGRWLVFYCFYVCVIWFLHVGVCLDWCVRYDVVCWGVAVICKIWEDEGGVSDSRLHTGVGSPRRRNRTAPTSVGYRFEACTPDHRGSSRRHVRLVAANTVWKYSSPLLKSNLHRPRPFRLSNVGYLNVSMDTPTHTVCNWTHCPFSPISFIRMYLLFSSIYHPFHGVGLYWYWTNSMWFGKNWAISDCELAGLGSQTSGWTCVCLSRVVSRALPPRPTIRQASGRLYAHIWWIRTTGRWCAILLFCYYFPLVHSLSQSAFVLE